MSSDESSSMVRLQRYLLATWARSREVISAPPFRVFLHPTDEAPEASVAMPERPLSSVDAIQVAQGLATLRGVFASRGRQARVVYFEALAPGLSDALARAGFVESGHELLLSCTRASYMPAPQIAGLIIDMHTAETPLDEVREGWNTNELGFNPGSERRATDAEAEAFRRELVEARAFLARLGGQPAAAGMFSAPVEGVTELLGIATLAPFRGRSIARALTARMTQAAFEHGCDLVFLRPDDERAARVYERVGFGRPTVVRAHSESRGEPPEPQA